MTPCPGCGKMVHHESRRCYSCGALLSARPADRRDRPSWDEDRPYDRSFAYDSEPPRRDSEPHRASTVLVLGVLSLACLLFFFIPILPALIAIILGGIGWYMGHVDLRRMREDTMDPSGRNTTQAGWVCSIIGTLLNLTWLLTCGGCIGWTQYRTIQQSQQMKAKTFQPVPKAVPAPPPPVKGMPAPKEKKGPAAEEDV
jgi:hypothetical protein